MTQPRQSRRTSVFWRVSGALVAAQLATGLLAIWFTVWFASDRSADLAENSLRVRIDALAEEIERAGAPLELGLEQLPEKILANLSYRFPDPVSLLDIDGQLLGVFYPASDAFEGPVSDSTVKPVVPGNAEARIAAGDITVDRSDDAVAGGSAIAALYDPSGIIVGGVMVQPITETMARELAPTRSAFRRALWTVILVAVAMAISLGAGFTWWMVRPLRRIAAQVEEIGAGNFDSRVDIEGDHEIARLGSAVNAMAEKVAESVEALKTTDRLRRELVANVGHDLRTPLAALKGFVEEGRRFQREERSDDVLRALLSADVQVNYIQRLVEDLFELSLLENPEPRLRREPVPLAELLNDVIRRHTGPMEEAKIEFIHDIPGSLPILEGDGTRLLRLLDNLLSNARRHTPADGRISLCAQELPAKVEICVEDSGEGMDAEVLALIFDRYFRGDTSRTRGDRGTGLGLAICRAIATSHGGALLAESEPGKGTRMTLTLPI